MCSYWAKCKYPFFGDIKQFLSNMNPSIHRALLSLTVKSILHKTETVNYHRNTRALDCSMANISTRSNKFPGVYSPEFLNALSLLRSPVSVLLQCVCRCRVNMGKEDVRTNKEALFLIFEVHQWSLYHYTVELRKKKKRRKKNRKNFTADFRGTYYNVKRNF